MIGAKIKNSLAFRLPLVYRAILCNTPIFKLTRSDNPEINLVMFCGKEQIPLLQQALYSIAKSFKKLPNIFLFTDKNLESDYCKRKLKWYPLSHLSIISTENCLKFHVSKGRDHLTKFADANPMGLKLAAILQILEQGKPVLYSDTDVLWYKDPSFLINGLLSQTNFQMALSVDYQPAYDINLIEKCDLQELSTPPFLCAGVLLIKEFPEHLNSTFEHLLQVATLKSNHFTEQTIFAYINKACGNNLLDEEKIIIKIDDQVAFFPKMKSNIIARHYVGAVRHLFWRDSFMLRTGLLR